MKNPFEIDLALIRRRAREQTREGFDTASDNVDNRRVLEVLNEALATKILCALRYKNHYVMARGAGSETVAREFLQRASDEQQHADALAERIAEIGGSLNLNFGVLATISQGQYRQDDNLRELIGEDLLADQTAIETYSANLRWLGETDPTSCRIMEQILAQEEEHASDLARLLEDLESPPAAAPVELLAS